MFRGGFSIASINKVRSKDIIYLCHPVQARMCKKSNLLISGIENIVNGF